jgi:cytochrome c
MFLESGVWKEMYDALKARKAEKVHSVFQTVREVCLACHVAEKVGFLNDSSVFSRTEKFPPLGK